MKIAPELVSWVEDDGKWFTEMHLAAGDAQRRAQTQFRAMLAVVRAARTHDHVWHATQERCDLCKALARLEKVSRGGGK